MLNFKKHTWTIPFHVHLGEACVTQHTALLAVCRMKFLLFFRLKNGDGTLPKTHQILQFIYTPEPTAAAVYRPRNYSTVT